MKKLSAKAQLKLDWGNLIKKHSKPLEKSKGAKGVAPSPYLESPKFEPPRKTQHVDSRGSMQGSTAKKEVLHYSGTEMLGVSILHKSCLQPIFNTDAAKEVAQMRR